MMEMKTNCAAMSVSAMIVALATVPVFADTTVVNGGTTYHWNEADGEVTGNFTNAVDAASWTAAAVYDIGKNLTINGDIVSDYGAFVKTGAGTLTLNGKFRLAQRCSNSNSQSVGSNRLSFSNDGETATAGYGWVFTIADGAVVLTNASASVESKFGQVNYDGVIIGCWSAASGEVEKDVLLEVKRGKITTSSNTHIGRHQGFVNNTVAGHPAKAILRISGGTYTQAGGKAITLGGISSAPSGMGGYNAEVRFELLDGSYDHSTSGTGFNVAQYPGQDATVFVSGGTFEDRVFKTAAYANGNYENSNPSPFLFDVCSNGTVKIEAFTNNDKNKSGPTTKIHVHDGGTFLCDNMVNKANGVIDIVVDGGTYGTCCMWANFKVVHKEMLPATVTSFQIGKNGATISARGHLSASGYVTAYLEKGFEPAADLGEGETDGGVTFLAQYDANVAELGGACTYAGPTRIEKGWLALTGDGALPMASPTTVSGGGLLATNKDIVVGSLTFDGSVALKLGPNRKIAATSSFSAMAGTLVSVSFADGEGANMETAVTRHPVLTVPVAAKSVLEGLTFNLASGSLRLAEIVVEDDAGGETATLYVSAAPATDAGASSAVFGSSFAGTKLTSAGYALDESSLIANGYAPGSYVLAYYIKGDASITGMLPAIVQRWKTAVYSEEAVSEGEYAGYTAITLTISDAEGRTATWTGGAGSDTSAANRNNWLGNEVPVFENAPYTVTFAEDGDTATLVGDVLVSGLQFDSSGGFTIAKGTDAAALTVTTGGLSVAECATARTYTFAAPTTFSGAQTWMVPPKQKIAFKDAMTDSDGKITVAGLNGALEFHGTNVIGGAMVVTGHTVFVTGLLGTPGHVDQGNSSRNGAKTLTLDTNESGAMKGLTVSNAVVEKPLYFHCKSGYGFITASAGTTNIMKGYVTWQQPWIGTSIGEGAELIFEGGLTTGHSMRMDGNGILRIREKPITATASVGWNINNGTFVIDVPGNTFKYLTLGYTPGNGATRILDLSVSDAFSNTSSGVLGVGFGFSSTFKPVTSGSAELRLHSTTQQVNVLAGTTWGTVKGDAGARIEVLKQEAIGDWTADLMYFSSKVEGNVTLAMKGTGTLSLTNQAFASTGDIEVDSGVIAFASNASWLNGTNVTVKGAGRLKISNGNTFSTRFAELSLADEGVIEVPTGVSQMFSEVFTNGVQLSCGRYASLPNGEGDFLAGGGTIVVRRKGVVFSVR